MTVPEFGVPDYVRAARHEWDLSDDGHEVLELGVTNETDTTLRLAPDGAGGVEFAAGGSITVKDEGSPLATAATTLDFVGDGVTASGTGATKTITIPAWAAALDDLTDVTLSTPAAGDRLRFNGSAWVNSTLHWQVLIDGTGSVVFAGTGHPVEVEVL